LFKLKFTSKLNFINSFLDLVIDEEKFQNDGKDQQLPKKQKELLKRIQVHQKFVCIQTDFYCLPFIIIG